MAFTPYVPPKTTPRTYVPEFTPYTPGNQPVQPVVPGSTPYTPPNPTTTPVVQPIHPEYTDRKGNKWRYNVTTGKTEIFLPGEGGWFDPEPMGMKGPTYTAEGFVEEPEPVVNNGPTGTAPTYTPGMNFGQGRIAGGKTADGGEYQRGWFQTGKSGNTEVDHEFYDANFDQAWKLATNQYGGSQGSDYQQWFQQFGRTAEADFNNSQPYDPDLHVANFIDEYAPQVKGIWDLMGSQRRGQSSNGVFAGRAMY